jgi:hypothetical protein
MRLWIRECARPPDAPIVCLPGTRSTPHCGSSGWAAMTMSGPFVSASNIGRSGSGTAIRSSGCGSVPTTISTSSSADPRSGETIAQGCPGPISNQTEVHITIRPCLAPGMRPEHIDAPQGRRTVHGLKTLGQRFPLAGQRRRQVFQQQLHSVAQRYASTPDPTRRNASRTGSLVLGF